MGQSENVSSQREFSSRRARKKPPRDDLYTASQAIAKTGIAKSTFQRLAREKRIQREVPPGKKEGFYPKSFIDNLTFHLQGKTSYQEVLAVLEQIAPITPSLRGVTDWIRFDDLPFVQHLDLELYGPDQTVDMSVTYRWWKKNPYMCRILFNAQDRRDIWGALTIMPLPEELIYRLLRQEISEREIKPEDIFVYEPGRAYHGYIASVIVRPQHQAHLRSLVQSMLDFWCQEYPEIRLQKLYAYGASAEGRRLIRHLFFSRRYDLGNNAWELDPMDQGNPSRLITSFQECIKRKEIA
jgi:hypothetical protein